MGSCYSVTVGVKFRDRKGAVDRLRRMVSGEYNRAQFPLGIDFDLAGRPTGTWDGLMKVFLADYPGQRVTCGTWRSSRLCRTDSAGYRVYSNAFNASYGWEAVMLEMFRAACPYLRDGSYIYIDCDDGANEAEARGGRFVQTYRQRERSQYGKEEGD